MKRPAPPKITPHRFYHYETAARMIRWACLLLVLVSYPFASPGGPAVIGLLLVVSFYNSLRYSRRLSHLPVVNSRINELAIDHFFVIFLVSLSGGIASPYYPLLLLLIVGMITSYSVVGFAVGLAVQASVLLALYWAPTPALPSDPWAQLAIRLSFLVIFSLVAEEAIKGQDAEHLLEDAYSRRLSRDRERLLTLLNSLADAAIATDEEGHITLYNGAALALLNTNADISGQTLDKVIDLVDEKGNNLTFAQLLPTEGPAVVRNDLTLVGEENDRTNLELTLSPVRLSSHGRTQLEGYIMVARDITRQRSLDQERDEFISVASHELRTPVAIAEANLSTALLPGYAKIEPKALTLLQQAHDNLILLGELVKDLTTLSRAERGDLRPDFGLVDITAVLAELQRDYGPSAESKGLKLVFKPGRQPISAVTSEQEVREILQNFVTNAIKYTEKGSINLAATTADDGRLGVAVTDTGIGVAASDKGRLFDKFFRSEDYRTRRTNGTGLGLYIARKLSERLGATITVDSRLNHGSTFTLWLSPRETEAA